MLNTLLVSPHFVPLGADVLRGLQVAFRPITDGRELTSPDGRFVARAASTYGPRLSGGWTSRYEFMVDERVGARLHYIEIPLPRDDLINWRLEGLITWADDSSSVTFEFKRTCLTLLIDEKRTAWKRTANESAATGCNTGTVSFGVAKHGLSTA